MALQFKGGKAVTANIGAQISPAVSKAQMINDQMHQLQSQWLDLSALVPDSHNRLRLQIGADIHSAGKAMQLALAELKELSKAV